jgi:hypothetical protein
MKSIFIIFTYILISIPISAAELGPQFDNLKPTVMYSRDGDMGLYIEFNEGAMPGCYSNKGGYLLESNKFFKDIHSQILMLAATNGMRGQVNFANDGPDGMWSECKILGLKIRP